MLRSRQGAMKVPRIDPVYSEIIQGRLYCLTGAGGRSGAPHVAHAQQRRRRLRQQRVRLHLRRVQQDRGSGSRGHKGGQEVESDSQDGAESSGCKNKARESQGCGPSPLSTMHYIR